jgi:hypothetical protein
MGAQALNRNRHRMEMASSVWNLDLPEFNFIEGDLLAQWIEDED